MATFPYISWTGHGSSCGEPPGVFTGATMHLFGLAADRNAMQRIVDRFLKPVAGTDFKYFAATDSALLTVCDIARCSTSTELIGWVPGQECALWIPLFEFDLKTFPPRTRIVMWSPYIFISYAVGMATGREVWGWSKALAKFEFPPAGAATPKFTVSTLIFETFDATLPGIEDATLLSVAGDAPLDTAATWGSLNDAVDNVIAKLTGFSSLGMLPNPMQLVPRFPAIALKQFRDSNAPELACFQALVNSPVHIRTFNGGGFHAANFTLEVTTCESHPIASTMLGVTPSPGSTILPIQWAAWVEFDFDAIAGSVIVQTV